MRTFTIATLIACAAVALGAARDDFRVQRQDRSEHTLHFAGSGVHTLDLRTIQGSIHVSADRRNDVRLSIARTVKGETDAAADEGLRDVRPEVIDNAETIGATVRYGRVGCGESSNGRSDDWWDRPRYQVAADMTAVVPADTRVRLCTINGETVEMTGVTGDFDVTNVNGKISLSGLRGSGNATTVNGPVTASFTSAPREASLFKTVNGDVTVTFPDSLSADLRLKTFHGGLFTDFDVESLSQQPQIDRRGTRVVYRSNRYTLVRAGQGGPEMTLETLNGDVRVLRASR